jgi:hypothetical protein
VTAVISRASIVGGHDGRAEIEVEMTYENGGRSTISLDVEACMASLDRAGIASIDDLVGQPWSVVLPAFERPGLSDARQRPSPHQAAREQQQQEQQQQQHQQGNGGAPNARSDHP